MRTKILLSVFLFIACDPVNTPPARDAAVHPSPASDTNGSALTVASTAAVTRHLPGTAIKTATGKYIYLVKSDGTLAPFSSAAVAEASGYPAAAIVTVSSEELYCYGRSDQINTALPASSAGKLRDGTLVSEKGKSDTYAVSDGVAWPIVNGTVFVEAGYAWANVVQ